MLDSPSSTLITLCMIVKNEAHVIERCLASVKPYIDQWIIVDTGSTDDTQQRIHASLKGVSGELHQRAWVNFGHNRTEALELARTLCRGAGHILVIDADDTLDAPHGFQWDALDMDAYMLRHTMAHIEFQRAQLFSASKPWKYVGAVHEHPVLEGAQVIGSIDEVTIRIGGDGARRLGDKTSKYLADALLLEEAVAQDPGDMRSLFYLAQSYRDAEKFGAAYQHYKKRSQGGGWEEEAWYALYQEGLMANALENTSEAIATLQKAFERRPNRREPVVALSRLYRNQGNWSMARLWSHYAVYAPFDLKGEQLFVEPACHGGWRALDELSLVAFDQGDHNEAVVLFERLLRDPSIPPMERDRIRQSLGSLIPCPGSEPYELSVSVPHTLEKFLTCFAKQEAIQSAIHLGSSLNFDVLKEVVSEVTSIDIEVVLWNEFTEDKSYELVILDIADIPQQAQYLPVAWQLLGDGGWLFINNMHRWPYRRQVEKFLALVDHRRFDVHEHTLDHHGRYGWLLRKFDVADPAC